MVRLISINTRGLGNEKKRRSVFQACRSRGDIIFLQETHSTREKELIWSTEWGGRIIFSHGSTDSKGVCILIKKELDYKIVNLNSDPDGRYIICDIRLDGKNLCLVNIYAPNRDSPAFFTNLMHRLRHASENKIIMGDFNLTLCNEIDRLNTYTNNNKSKEIVIELMEQFSLQDIWRVRNPEQKQYTWYRKKRNEDIQASRIDLALTDTTLNIENVTFYPAIYTDHRAIFLSIDLTQGQKRGPGYWKFNNSLLKNKDFLEFMSHEISNILNQTNEHCPINKWLKLKRGITESAQRFSRRNKSETQLVMSQLMEKIDELQARLPLTQQEYDILENSMIELEEMQNNYIQGVMFRSKAKWLIEIERNTRYFLNLEKSRFQSKVCDRLFIGDLETTDPCRITNEQVAFYSELYTSDKQIRFTLKNNSEVRINPDSVNEMQFSMSEIAQAAFSLNNDKTPGKDGIGIDFYKVFWKDISYCYKEMIDACFKNEALPVDITTGVLNLIPKAGKDPRYLKNLRPITLLNTDYKIIEKCISNRIKPRLANIINSDQTGFMADRRISTNIRKIYDIMFRSEKNEEQVIVLCCDFLKCFDRVEFTCITNALTYFGFENILIKWVEILYQNFKIRIQNNGYLSEEINVTRSIHQGGCCSAELFIICAEILAIMIRDSDKIDPVHVEEIVHLINQFADDLNATLHFDQESVTEILNIFEIFRQNSGFTLNYDKTTVYRVGSLKNSEAKLYTQKQLNWTNDPINILGIWITPNREQCDILNYEPVIDKIATICQTWSKRNLSLIGKVTIINTLIASLLVYKLTVLPNIKTKYIQTIENIILKFLWNGNKAKIPTENTPNA